MAFFHEDDTLAVVSEDPAWFIRGCRRPNPRFTLAFYSENDIGVRRCRRWKQDADQAPPFGFSGGADGKGYSQVSVDTGRLLPCPEEISLRGLPLSVSKSDETGCAHSQKYKRISVVGHTLGGRGLGMCSGVRIAFVA